VGGTRRDFLFLAAALVLPAGSFAADDLLARLRRGNAVLLMRHGATEPGLGDPKGYRLDDCATQRNLSAAGRDEARRVGERLARERIRIDRVYSSPWCRCRETAKLAFGRSEDWDALSSVFDFPEREADYSERVRQRIAAYERRARGGNLALVTHNVNIAALTRESVAPAEIVVVEAQGCCGLRNLGRLLLAQAAHAQE
jgi:broad specificity phosphatase PhoE